MRLLCILLLFIFLGSTKNLHAQYTAPPKVYLNCTTNCYDDYVRSELSFFDFVRDRYVADIEILISRIRTGSGGHEYTLTFYGQNKYAAINDTIKFDTQQADTQDIIRTSLVKYIKMGLIRYILDSDLMKTISIDFPERQAIAVVPVPDKWNFWVFRLGGRGSFNSESNKKNTSIRTDLSINRVTDASKFSVYSYHNQYFNRYVVDGEEVTARNTNYGLSGLYVKSFSDNWSAGGFYRGYHSVYQNIRFSHSVAPALEYSVYPVSEVLRHQLRWVYQAGIRKLNYIETTIFDKQQETLPYHQLSGIMGITELWGSFSAELSAYQYLHDLSKNSLSLEMDLNWRVAQGLSVWLNSNISLINNQISLAKSEGDASQILLNNRQLPTNFRFGSSFGMTYTFGSISNNVINPRFSGVD
ncbi:hypothetical protein [Telluribacter sp.]|jgi:hypothetical protein|uniref:hypothetical protein n=1 Tax=Telluribacter sp. TaxID=1978767 RepID=UPI002E15929F|nr:hypothetical protein [Telluribacter sp.]